MTSATCPITKAVELRGWNPLAKACDVTPQAIRKWMEAGRLPQTEFVGTTNYAGIIERETDGKVTKESLIQWSRRGWKIRKAS